MDEKQRRLADCFAAVFPELSKEEILQASSSTVKSWDSVAVVTLLAVIEEEFGVTIGDEDPSKFDSFQHILSYLQDSQWKGQSTTDVG